MGNDDRGQLLPLVALLVAMALGLAVLIVETALLVGERAAAQTAADAAALASVVEPGEMAVANGAVLESFRQLGASVEVTVRVGRASATARAVAAPCRGERCRPYAYP